VFEALAAMVETSFTLTGGGDPERTEGAQVTATMFPLLGVEPAQGRFFSAEEDEPGSGKVVVLSHGLWQRRFGSDSSLVGEKIDINGQARTVVGIMPEGFQFPPPFSRDGESYATKHELWIPLVLTPDQYNQRIDHYLRVLGRLKPGLTVEKAQAEMETIVGKINRDYPDEHADIEAHVVSLHEQVVGFVQPALLILLAGSGLVLLIACVNVANLLIARASTRQREMAVRSALGAGRPRLVRQLLTESVLLAGAGGALGLLLAHWGFRLLVVFVPGSVPRFDNFDSISLSPTLLALTAAVSVLTGIIFGLAPAWQFPRLDLQDSLKEGGRASTQGSRGGRLKSSLIVVEVALALTLLIGAGALLRSFLHLSRVDPGFRAENVLVMDLSLSESKYPEGRQRAAFFQQVVSRTEKLTGVVAAGANSHLPLSGSVFGNAALIEGRPVTSLKDIPTTACGVVTPGYFRAMGIPLLEGRMFTDLDSMESNPVAIINQTMARRYWPHTNPLGKRIKQGRPESDLPWITIVGVVGDVKQWGLTAEVRPEVYLPHLQDPFRSFPAADQKAMTLVIRSESDLMSLVPVTRKMIRQ
jgi:putative ABC transport system permease protein